MSIEQWTLVDQYIVDALVPPDAALDAALAASEAAGLPGINVSPNQGKLLHLLARLRGSSSILEVGTLGGYSSIWLARALKPGGKLVTLELSERHAQVARENLRRAGLAETVDVRVGSALELLPALAQEKRAPFDFVFIDADKQNVPSYFDWAVKLSASGSVIVVDNTVRRGAVADPSTTDANVKGVQGLHERLRNHRGIDATTIQTVGSKGYDGFTLAIVA
ncbi:MAG: O-methyltransferase [Polyangiaceae bacterium]|jgi:predicted O-methyltransferase YrrM|nr:O-methyltransferase [Polyangiaceae bacterium]